MEEVRAVKSCLSESDGGMGGGLPALTYEVSRARRPQAGARRLDRMVGRSRYAEQAQAARLSRNVEVHAFDSEA